MCKFRDDWLGSCGDTIKHVRYLSSGKGLDFLAAAAVPQWGWESIGANTVMM